MTPKKKHGGEPFRDDPLISVPSVDGRHVSSIGRGLCVLLGISRDDEQKEADWM